jgi:UDP-glucose-4-epimerase GalE
VLVTGGAGYVGSVTARHVAATGRPVVVLDDFSTGHRDACRFGTLVEGDVADAALVRATLRREKVTAVLHFAAKALVAESVREPDLYDRWNRGKTATLLQTCRGEGVRAFVFSSTCSVYGDPKEVPIPEGHARFPTNPYGRSKKACEDLLGTSGIPAAALRYFNAAGAEPAERLGERHDPETHLIPVAVRAALRGETITVFGTDWPTPDGTCVRDYVHVADLAEAHVKAMARLEKGEPGGAWNLGTGRGHSVREVLAAVERATGRKVARVDGPRRAGDVAALVAKADRARADLGWTPTRSALDRIVADAVAFATPARESAKPPGRGGGPVG